MFTAIHDWIWHHSERTASAFRDQEIITVFCENQIKSVNKTFLGSAEFLTLKIDVTRCYLQY